MLNIGVMFKASLPVVVQTLYDFTESPFTQGVDYLIWVADWGETDRYHGRFVFRLPTAPDLILTSVFQDVPTLVDQVTVLSVPLAVDRSLGAAPLKKQGQTKMWDRWSKRSKTSGQRSTYLCRLHH